MYGFVLSFILSLSPPLSFSFARFLSLNSIHRCVLSLDSWSHRSLLLWHNKLNEKIRFSLRLKSRTNRKKSGGDSETKSFTEITLYYHKPVNDKTVLYRIFADRLRGKKRSRTHTPKQEAQWILFYFYSHHKELFFSKTFYQMHY